MTDSNDFFKDVSSGMFGDVQTIWNGLSKEEQNNVLAGKPVSSITENEAEAIRRWLNSLLTDVLSPEPLKEYQAATTTSPSRPSSEVNPLDFYKRDALSDVTEENEENLNDRVVDALAQLGFNPDGTLIDTSATPGALTQPAGQSTSYINIESDQEEVKRILAERFGGIGWFLDTDNPDMLVGIATDASGRRYIVAADDPVAEQAVDLLTAIEMTGITSDSQILAAVQKTKWHQETDALMRKYDLDVANMNPLELKEYLEPVLNILNDEAVFLGIQLDPARAMELAGEIKRQGKDTDLDAIRGLLNSEGLYIAANLQSSGFANMTDGIMALSRSYFTPINETAAANYANQLYLGTQTEEGLNAYFRDQAALRYPFMANALNSGQTPEAYFAPYTYEVERLLGRKNIDLYEEFPDIVEGIRMSNGEYRPMTTHELRRYVRGLDEWQQSPQGLDSARSLSFAIGELFGEVA